MILRQRVFRGWINILHDFHGDKKTHVDSNVLGTVNIYIIELGFHELYSNGLQRRFDEVWCPGSVTGAQMAFQREDQSLSWLTKHLSNHFLSSKEYHIIIIIITLYLIYSKHQEDAGVIQNHWRSSGDPVSGRWVETPKTDPMMSEQKGGVNVVTY